MSAENKFEEGRWSKEEHERFVKALELYDRNWKKVHSNDIFFV